MGSSRARGGHKGSYSGGNIRQGMKAEAFGIYFKCTRNLQRVLGMRVI